MKWPTITLVKDENPWVTYAKRQVYKKNNCINLMVNGGPGKGKSWGLLSYFCLIDPDFDLNEQWVFRGKDLIKYFENNRVKKGKPIGYDESGIDANANKWQDEINKGLNAFFQTGRYLNYIFGMSVPFRSFVSKGVRTLMNCQFRAEGWNSSNQTIIKPLVLEWNDELQKFYRKRLLVKSSNGLDYCNEIRLPKPPKKIIIEYEKLKQEFTTNLYRDIGRKIEAHERKESIVPQMVLTTNQEDVLDDLEGGMVKDAISKKKGYTVANVTRIIGDLRKKGIKIQPEPDKNGRIIRYKVVRPHNV